MTTDRAVEIALELGPPILTAIVTTALGIFGLVIGDWRQRRTQAGRRKLALEDAGRKVAFAAEWWKTRKLLADSPEAEQQATSRALAWLEEASALVADSKPTPVEDEPAITLRRLLLAYPMQSRTARRLRVAFYTCLSLVPIWVGVILRAAVRREETVDIGSPVLIVVSMGFAMVFRFGAIRAEELEPTGENGTLGRAFLLYRFHRSAAKFVRIIFYLWVAISISFAIGAFALDPVGAGAFVGFVGWAVFLRYWAASLESHGASEASFGTTTVDTADENATSVSIQPIGPNPLTKTQPPHRAQQL